MSPEEYALAQERESIIQDVLSRISISLDFDLQDTARGSVPALVVRIMVGDRVLCSDYVTKKTLRSELGD